MRVSRTIFLLFLSFLGLLPSCRTIEEKPEEIVRPNRGSSYLKFVNAIPSAPRTQIYGRYYNTESRLADSLVYGAVLPEQSYLKIEATVPPDEFGYSRNTIQARSLTQNVLIPEYDLILSQNVKKTVFLVDSAGKWIFFQTNDEYTYQDSSKAYYRFLNLNASVGAVKLVTDTLPGSTYPEVNTSDKSFLNENRFVPMNYGTYHFRVMQDNQVLASLLSVKIDSLKAYTFYFSGSELKYYKHEK